MLSISNIIWPKYPTDSAYTVSVAESITAGALANTLCSEPGASQFFKGGIIAYSIQSKCDILGINIKYAEKHNFANPFTTSEMARSVSKMFNSRIGMSTTGYSLPTYRDEDLEKGLCELKVDHPYAYICLYDSYTNSEIVKRVDFEYESKQPDKIQRASVQTKVALEGRKMLNSYKKTINCPDSSKNKTQ